MTTDQTTTAGTICDHPDHTTCTHPEGATLHLGGTAWAHPDAAPHLHPIHTLTPYPGNPRRGDQDQITTSIHDLGFYGTIHTQASTGHVLVGNHRLRGLLALDAVLAPVTTLHINNTTAAAVVARDNYTSDQAGNDPDDLLALLTQLEQAEALPLVGGLADDLAALRALDAAAVVVPPGPSLADRFLVPPFSVLDARSGVWQARKREWLLLGIASEVGRSNGLIGGIKGQPNQGLGGLTDQFSSSFSGGSYEQQRREARRKEKGQAETPPARVRSGAYGAKATTAADGTLTYEVTTGATSIFDPVLCELAYRWFTPTGALVLDPFAGGSVRGIVAAALGRRYAGIELRPEQVAANTVQADTILPRYTTDTPTWVQGDAREVLGRTDPLEPSGLADLLFSCPPYADLEVYSDDPADLSAMEWPAFCEAYRQIIIAAVARLRPDRFAVWVVGEVRDPRGVYRNLVGETVRAFEAAGARYYNDAVLVTPARSLPIRAGKQFTATRKLGKTHQNVLVFCKGDPRKATEYAGQVEVAWPEGWDATE